MDKAEASRLFDDNARTYDRVNDVISLGLDSRWYEWAARRAVSHRGARVLDAFAGTGRVGVRAAQLGAQVTLADISSKMLEVACWRAREMDVNVTTAETDLAAQTPDVEGPFDALTVMWGVRYLDDPAATLARLVRLVVPGGRVIVVDFVEPGGGLVTRAAAWYFFRVLPRVASLLAGRRGLYRELIATTRAMGTRENLLAIVRDAGLDCVEQRVMGFGLVVGIVAVVPTTTGQ